MQIDRNIFRWLGSHKILGVADKIQGTGEDNLYELDSQITRQMEIGTKIGELLEHINKSNQNYSGSLSLDKLKDSSTPASRLYNWNILSEAMKKMGITLDSDIKGLIVSGDTQMLAEILKDIYDFDMNQLEKMSIPSSANSTISNPRSSLKRDLKSSSRRGNGGIYEETMKQNAEGKQQKLDGDAGVDLNSLDTTKNLGETKSLLEFFLVAISRHFALRPKQAATLLSNGNKYLAHVLVKGLKSEFQPVEKFLQDIYVNTKRLLVFVEVEESTIPILLNTLKPALLSKSEEVSMWSCRILTKLIFDMANLELLAPAYDWFTSQMGGLYSAVMCLRRHQNLKDTIVGFMLQVSRYNLNDLLMVQLKTIIENNKEYIDFINLIFPALKASKMSKEEILTGGMVSNWVDNCLKMGESDPIKNSIPDRESALSLLVCIWKSYPLFIEETPQLLERVLDLLKKASRDHSLCLSTGSIAKLFELLDFLATDRNPLAAVIYKKLTFSFVENHADIHTRQFILHNFALAFQKFPSIPVEVLVEPFIKQIQVSQNETYFLNVCDLEFLKITADHPKLKLKLALQLIDLLSKIYLNDIVFSQSLFDPITQIIGKFIADEPFQEYLVKLAKIALAMFFNSCRNRKGNNKQRYDKYGKNLYEALNQANETEILHAQKRGLIIQLLKVLVEQQRQDMNDQLKPLIVHVYIQLKQIGQESKGITMLLGLLGDPESIIAEIQAQNQIQEVEEKERLKRLEEYNQLYNEATGEGGQDSASSRRQKENVSQPGDDDNDDQTFEEQMKKQQYSEEDFLFKNGVGLKPNKNEKSKKNTGNNNSNNADKILNSKAIIQIEQIKQRREEELRKKQEEEELKKAKMAQQIKAAEKEINKRNGKIPIGSNDEAMKQMLYEEGEIKQGQFNENIVQLVNTDELEERDRESIQVSLKKYHKAIKALVNKYAKNTTPIKKGEYFGQLEAKSDTLSVQDIVKMARDSDLLDICSKEELANLLKLHNGKYYEKSDLSNLSPDDVGKYLTQVALLVFSRPPKDMRGQPAGNYLEALFRQIGNAAKKRGEPNPAIFLNPEYAGMSLMEQSDVKSMNVQLANDPDTILPDNYKRVLEKNVVYDYDVQVDKIQGKLNGYLEAYSLVNEVFNQLFKVNIIEPISKVVVVAKAKVVPATANKKQINNVQQLVKEQSQPQATKENQGISNDDQEGDTQSVRSLKSGQIGRISHLKSLGEISSGENNNNNGNQKEKTAIERGRTKSPSRGILNKATQNKLDQAEQELKRKQIQDAKLKQRQMELKEQLEKIKEEKKDQEMRQKEEERIKKQEQEDQERKRQEKLKKEQELKKQKLKDHQIKLEEDKKQKETQQLETKKEQELMKKKEIDDFMRKQKQKLEKEFQEKEQLKIKEKEDKEKEKEAEKIKEEARKKKVNQAIDKEKEKREKDKEFKRRLEELEKLPAAQEILQKNDRQLKAVFNQFKEYTDFKIEKSDKDNLTFKGYMQFMQQFNISGTVLSAEELNQLFRVLVKDKNIADSSISYNNFMSILIRLSVAARGFFAGIAGGNIQATSTAELALIAKEELKKNNNNNNKQDFEDLDESACVQSLQGLMRYLNLPQDKLELAAKLRALKGDNLQQKVISTQKQPPSVEESQKDGVRGRQASKTRETSRNRSISKNNINSNKENIKNPNGQDRSRSSSIKAVDVHELKSGAGSKINNIIAPDGQKEKWESH